MSKNTKNTKNVVAPKAYNGGLAPTFIYTKTGKLARATHNAERHTTLNGLTVADALASNLVTAQDIKYDVAKGFITLEAPAKK
tara:strand:+ start:1072 stop:1320 length:249 start_codon:yes stop_codon:yes gene_type:complete